MKKIRVGILFGGRSGEHEVSLTSAASILRGMNPDKYEIYPIGITREGRWRLGKESEKELERVLSQGRPVAVSPYPDSSSQRLISLSPEGGDDPLPKLDVIFPVLHGTYGEDGTVQGLLELASVPYIGAGVLGSAVAMDKAVMRRLFREAGLPQVPSTSLRWSQWQIEPAKVRREVEKKFRYPIFVKPANLGSSVGISKVHGRRELDPALDLAFSYDSKVVVEQGVRAREIECSVLGNERAQASLPGEIIPVNEFYDYEAKYVKEGSDLVIPAKLTPRKTRQVQAMAVRAFEATECAGMARVDFLLERRTGKLYLNEINTIPGFTPISMYPKLWEASGLPFPKLLNRLIALAFERQQERTRTRFDYQPEQG